jgi:hypothetical protein
VKGIKRKRKNKVDLLNIHLKCPLDFTWHISSQFMCAKFIEVVSIFQKVKGHQDDEQQSKKKKKKKKNKKKKGKGNAL